MQKRLLIGTNYRLIIIYFVYSYSHVVPRLWPAVRKLLSAQACPKNICMMRTKEIAKEKSPNKRKNKGNRIPPPNPHLRMP